MTECRSCGLPVQWVMGKSKLFPVDAIPNPAGNVVVTEGRGQARGEVLGKEAAIAARGRGERLWMPHHVTCPDAETWSSGAGGVVWTKCTTKGWAARLSTSHGKDMSLCKHRHSTREQAIECAKTTWPEAKVMG